MSLSACQGLQSCLEPRLKEPRVYRLELAPPKSINSSQSLGSSHRSSVSGPQEPKDHSNNEDNNNCDGKSHRNGDLGGWSFMQALANPSNSSKEVTEKETVYVHPLVTHSSSKLSKKSLEMCTESLGSETGSDISESSDELISSLPYESTGNKCVARERSNMTKKLHRSRSFPPPLTSISGSGCVQVRPHREGGRLVIKAITVPPCHTYFKAERGDGRLRLRLLKDYPSSCDEDEAGDDEKEKDNTSTDQEGAEEEEVEDIEAEAEDSEEEQEEEEEEEEEEDGGDGNGDGDGYWGSEEMEGNSENVGDERGLGKFRHRPSRCKEGGNGNKGMLWEPFWVAT